MMIEKDAGKKGCDAHFGTVVLVLVRNLMKGLLERGDNTRRNNKFKTIWK